MGEFAVLCARRIGIYMPVIDWQLATRINQTRFNAPFPPRRPQQIGVAPSFYGKPQWHAAADDAKLKLKRP
jgi:hypothetical protein